MRSDALCIQLSAIPDERSEGKAGGRILPASLGIEPQGIGDLMKSSYSERERLAVEDAAIITLAGQLAEDKRRNKASQVPKEPDTLAAIAALPTDVKAVFVFVDALTKSSGEPFDDCLNRLFLASEALVEAHWALIEAVAHELATRGELSGVEFENVIYREVV